MQALRSKLTSRNIEATMARLKRARIRQILEYRSFRTAYQPMFRLSDNTIEGLECLTRFSIEPGRASDRWFADAADVGLGVELEVETFQAGLSALPFLPDGCYLALNVSPDALLSGRIAGLLERVDPTSVVLEVTEHVQVSDYAQLCAALSPLRTRGVRLAIDDVGAGFASMRHILNLQPDLIKLDLSLTRGVDASPARAALTQGLIHFARTMNSRVVAEGVETLPQLKTLRELGVDVVQGYFVGHPILPEPLLGAS